MEKFVAYSVSDVIKFVSEISETHQELWFRGQSNADYQLEPSLLRYKKEILQTYKREIRYKTPSFKNALNSFKRKSKPFISYTPQNDFEWMFLMQHYGVPTRLLDWSTSALVALYFALNGIINIDEDIDMEEGICTFEKTGYSKHGAAIYIMNPHEINKTSNNIVGILDISEECDEWKHYLHPSGEFKSNFPICISASHIDKRIRSQSGMFTLHGNRVEPLDWYTALNQLIYKIYIPYQCVKKMKEELKLLGITASFVFPDLDGLAKEITEDIVDDFHNI
ncbi:FRG domain-containing protein [Photobacterium sp. J15]|uniref:FRG domain-containing protein n=1 Tax=Photobacterium sp. J15 TaxID=265901 RepID=UPI0007E3D5EA|nr:FRG domain-containing protein [Photobacterium sp. J15]